MDCRGAVVSTTYYVDGSHGDDANNGQSWALAKATLGGAESARSTGDPVFVAPGLYVEQITLTKSGAWTSSQRHAAHVYSSGAACFTVSGNIDVVISGFSLTVPYGGNYAPCVYAAAIVSPNALTVDDCVCASLGNNGYGIRGGGLTPLVVTNSVIRLAASVATNIRNIIDGTAYCRISGNTLIGGVTTHSSSRGIYMSAAAGYGDYEIYDNIVLSPAARPYVEIVNVAANLVLNYNRYFQAIDGFRLLSIYGTTYTTLAAAQGAGYEANGSEGDPSWADADRYAYFLPLDSALLTAGSDGGRVGACTGAQTYSGGAEDWSGWTGTNSTYVDQQWTLDDGQASGTVLSPVIDLGSVQQITGLSLLAVQTFPTNVVDTSNAGASPEYLTVEIRGQAVSFLTGDGVPAWQEVNYNAEDDTPLIAGRYCQVRLTLRSDGS